MELATFKLENWLQEKCLVPSRAIIPLLHPQPSELDAYLTQLERSRNVVIISATDAPASTETQTFLWVCDRICEQLNGFKCKARSEADYQVRELLNKTRTSVIVINSAHKLNNKLLNKFFDWCERYDAESSEIGKQESILVLILPDVKQISRKSFRNYLPDYLRRPINLNQPG